MFIHLKGAIEIFSNFVNTFGACLNQNKGRETRRRCLTTSISHILMTVCWDKLQSKRLWDLSCTGNRFVPEEIPNNANLPFLNALKGWMYWVFSDLSSEDSLIFLSHKKKMTQKFLLSCFCFLKRSLIQQLWYFMVHWQRLLFWHFCCVWRLLLNWKIYEWCLMPLAKISWSPVIFFHCFTICQW